MNLSDISLDATVTRLMPLIKAINFNNAPAHCHMFGATGNSNMSLCQTPITMTLCDEPKRKPTRITKAYEARIEELRVALQSALGSCWAVIQFDLNLANDGDLLFQPDPAILVYGEQNGYVIPGFTKRSWTALKIQFLIKEFDTPELCLAWQICR